MSSRQSRYLVMPLLLIFLLFFSPLTHTKEKGTLVFGVHPFKKPTKTYSMFLPLIKHLSSEMNTDISLVIGKNYDDIIAKHKKGEIDFGYFGPASFAITTLDTKLYPLARIKQNGHGAFKGVIVIRENSDLTSIEQLKGKSFAFGDKKSTLSHYVPHYMLLQSGITLKDLSFYEYTGNHDNVALNVKNGKFHAGGLKPQVAKLHVGKGLKILAESEWIPEHLFAANEHMESTLREKLKQALQSTPLNYLKSIKRSITGLEAVSNRDYDQLREIIRVVDEDAP